MKMAFCKKTMVLFVAMVLLLTVAGCGSSTTGNDQQSTAATLDKTASDTSSAASTVTSAPSKPVTLKMIQHTNQASNDAVEVLNQKFHEKYPNITIDDSNIVETAQYVQLVQTRIAAGDVDILEFTCFNLAVPDWTKGLTKKANTLYIENGDILDLTDQPFIKNWPESTIKGSMMYNGKIYNVTTGQNANNGLFYSKDIFDKYGLKVPETWDEFISICKTLQSNDIAPMTCGAKDGWPLAMVWEGFVTAFEPNPEALAKGLWTGERKFNDPQTLKLFEKMAEFASYFEKGVTAVDYASVIGRFVSGKAAMMPDGIWDAANISIADPNFKFSYFTLPGDTKGDQPQQFAGKYEYGFAGYAKTTHKDEVLKWLEFFSQKDIYTEFVNACGFIPAMDGVEITNGFINSMAPFNHNFQKAYGYINKSPTGLGKYGGFAISQLKVLGGEIASAKELADLAQADWDAALAAVK